MDRYLGVWTEHLRVHRGRQDGGVRKYLETMTRFIKWSRENGQPVEPRQVKREQIEGWMADLFYNQGNIRNSSRATKLSILRSFFGFLVYAKIISTDPTKKIPTPRVHSVMAQKFTTEELKLIFRAPEAGTIYGLRDLAILMTIYGAGLRVSELSGLDIGDISDSGGYIRLQITGKGGKQRLVTLRNTPAKVLRQWLGVREGYLLDHDAVFIRLQANSNHRIGIQAIQKMLKKYGSAVGIADADIFCHKMRSTFATDLYDSIRDRCPRCGHSVEQVGILEIMVLMGHSDPKTTMKYIAISEKVIKKTAIPDRRWHELLD